MANHVDLIVLVALMGFAILVVILGAAPRRTDRLPTSTHEPSRGSGRRRPRMQWTVDGPDDFWL